MLSLFAGRVSLLWGWRRLLLAFSAGSFSALAMAPWHFFPVLFITFPVLIWLLDGTSEIEGVRFSSLRAAFGVGWAFGFGFFLCSLYWIGWAFLVEAEVFAWALPFAVALLPAGLALFTATACATARLVWMPGAGRIIALAVTYSAFAWARGWMFTGLPWNLMGYALTGSPEILQLTSHIGIYGLTLFTLLLVSTPALLADYDDMAGLPRRRIWAFPAVMICLFALIWGSGAYRLANAGQGNVNGVSLRIIQPNIAQKEKWQKKNRSAILNTLLDMSDRATSPRHMGISDVTHLIWPEVALPFLVLENKSALAAIAALLPDKTMLITGAIRREKAKGKAEEKFYNSVLVIDGDGRLAASYDKTHLVPFGEYLPFQTWLEKIGLQQLTRLRGGFTPGRERRNITPGNAPPFSSLICYEIIFSAAVTGGKRRPGWIINVTNDAWFGKTAGPHQHFNSAQLRAVEEGIPVIRAANTGISGVIDPYGRVIKQIGLNNRGVIDAPLPRALPPTIFARYGNWVFMLLLLGCGGWVIYRYHCYRQLVYTGVTA